MCNHIYKVIEVKDGTETNKKCEWVEYYGNLLSSKFYSLLKYKDLPCDNNGKCIFHSQNSQWKRANHFFARFYELCQYWKNVNNELDQESSLYFHECHFVGIESDFKYDFEDTTSFGMYFENFILNNDILFYDCIFYDDIHIDRGIFKEGITLENCIFKRDIDLINIVVAKDINLAPENKFNAKVQLTNMKLFGKFDCLKNTFRNILDFSYLDCREDVLIDNSIFENKHEYVNFSAHFHAGISFRSNIFNGLLKFEDTTFEGDSMFYDNQVSVFHLHESQIGGNIAFVGTEDNLLFTPNSIIDLEKENFGENGRLIFDYCNILNLGNDFITKVREFENYQLVGIRETCKVNRLTIVREYIYSQVNDYIITDLSNLITRLFKYYASINLNVEIIRDEKKRLLKLILKTTDNVDAEKFDDTIHNISSRIIQLYQSKYESLHTSQEKDFSSTIQSILNRLLTQFHLKEISEHDAISILTLQGLLPINKDINIFINNIIGDGNLLLGNNSSITAPVNIKVNKDVMNNINHNVESFFDKSISLFDLNKINQNIFTKKNTSEHTKKIIDEIKKEIDNLNIGSAFEKIDNFLNKTNPYIEFMRKTFMTNGSRDFDFFERFKLCIEFVIIEQCGV